MPRIKSAIKRVKTAEKSHLRNIAYKSKIKTNIKKFDQALEEKNENEVIKYFKDLVSILDKAVNKGILPKGTASRKKSRLAKKLTTLIKPGQITKSEETVKVDEKPIVKKITKPTKETKNKVTKKTAKKTETEKNEKSVKAKTEIKAN